LVFSKARHTYWFLWRDDQEEIVSHIFKVGREDLPRTRDDALQGVILRSDDASIPWASLVSTPWASLPSQGPLAAWEMEPAAATPRDSTPRSWQASAALRAVTMMERRRNSLTLRMTWSIWTKYLSELKLPGRVFATMGNSEQRLMRSILFHAWVSIARESARHNPEAAELPSSQRNATETKIQQLSHNSSSPQGTILERDRSITPRNARAARTAHAVKKPSWREWSGRHDGKDSYKRGDIVRGLIRIMRKRDLNISRPNEFRSPTRRPVRHDEFPEEEAGSTTSPSPNDRRSYARSEEESDIGYTLPPMLLEASWLGGNQPCILLTRRWVWARCHMLICGYHVHLSTRIAEQMPRVAL